MLDGYSLLVSDNDKNTLKFVAGGKLSFLNNKSKLDGYICNGKFILPNILDNENNYNCEVLNNLFYNGNIKKYFILE